MNLDPSPRRRSTLPPGFTFPLPVPTEEPSGAARTRKGTVEMFAYRDVSPNVHTFVIEPEIPFIASSQEPRFLPNGDRSWRI